MNRKDLSLIRKSVEDIREEKKRPSSLDLGLFRRLFAHTRPYAAMRNWLFFCVILRSLQLPALAWIIAAVINGPVSNRDLGGIVWAAVGFLAFCVLTQLTMHFRQRLALQLGECVVFDLRNAVIAQVLRLPMAYFNKAKLGSILARLTSDMEALRTGVQNVLFVTLVQAGQMLGSGTLMAFYNWRLFLVILAMAPILYGINRYFQKRISQLARDTQASFSRVTASIAESVKGIRVTQGFSREGVNADLFQRLVYDHSGYNLGLSRSIALYLPLLELNSQIFIALTLLIGGYGVLSPEWAMPIGDLVAFFFLANLFFSPIQSIGQQFTSALSAMAGAERVFEVLDRKPEWNDAPDAIDPPEIRGEVEFDHVDFHYEPDKPVLHDLSFTVPAGDTVALVGHTGSGKSSIINLVCKFYLPVRGHIRIDGHDLTRLRSDGLHRQMGMVLQQNFLFSGTVMDNIRMGKPGASDAEVVEAAEKLGCRDLFDNMKAGFQTPIGERGAGLSQGQQQLVCFARAMLADPRILILDEATSSVDTLTEARLQKALETLLRDRTSFIVAHRLSTIRKADRILVLDHGRLVESGSHTELLEKDGTYAGLYRSFVQT
ncbi:MAG: ABC transporter ATP-binding protein [Opitutales bacterium]